MKRIFTALSLIGILIISSLVLAQHFWRGKTMSLKEVEKKWGVESFNSEQFRSGTSEIRAKMAASLMKDKRFIGKTVTEIRSQFGDPDGYYFTDTYPAYIIQEGKNKGDETWQIVFLLGRNRKISKIVVHKNCCD